MKNIRVFLSENCQFLEMKFSIYLNRRVFVMGCRKQMLLKAICSLKLNIFQEKDKQFCKLKATCKMFANKTVTTIVCISKTN